MFRTPMLPCLSIRRALVVDDSMLIAILFAVCWKNMDSKSKRQSTDSIALRALNTFRPAVIFTDLEMPKMNGHQFIDFLKAHPDTYHIPIVVLSAKPSPYLPRADICMKKDVDIHAELRKVLSSRSPIAKHWSGRA